MPTPSTQPKPLYASHIDRWRSGGNQSRSVIATRTQPTGDRRPRTAASPRRSNEDPPLGPDARSKHDGEVVSRSKKSVPAAGEIPINDAGAFELGPPVLLEGEDIAQYEGLLARVTAAVVSADIIEEFWVRDMVDLVWEALRLRRLKVEFASFVHCSGFAASAGPARRLRGARSTYQILVRPRRERLEGGRNVTGTSGPDDGSRHGRDTLRKARRRRAHRPHDRERGGAPACGFARDRPAPGAVAARLRAAAEAIEGAGLRRSRQGGECGMTSARQISPTGGTRAAVPAHVRTRQKPFRAQRYEAWAFLFPCFRIRPSRLRWRGSRPRSPAEKTRF